MWRATLNLSSITKQNNQRQEHNECEKNVEWSFILIIYHENINKNERNKSYGARYVEQIENNEGNYLYL